MIYNISWCNVYIVYVNEMIAFVGKEHITLTYRNYIDINYHAMPALGGFLSIAISLYQACYH